MKTKKIAKNFCKKYSSIFNFNQYSIETILDKTIVVWYLDYEWVYENQQSILNETNNILFVMNLLDFVFRFIGMGTLSINVNGQTFYLITVNEKPFFKCDEHVRKFMIGHEVGHCILNHIDNCMFGINSELDADTYGLKFGAFDVYNILEYLRQNIYKIKYKSGKIYIKRASKLYKKYKEYSFRKTLQYRYNILNSKEF